MLTISPIRYICFSFIEAAAAANPSGASSATFNRPKKAVANSMKEQIATPGQKQLQQQQMLTPALTVTSDTIGIGTVPASGTSPGRKTTFDVIHPELNPDIHDIQLLASMQEEELRRCLQNLQQMNRRRRTSSGNQKDGDASPVTPQPNATGKRVCFICGLE